jgi:hypothetical protein
MSAFTKTFASTVLLALLAVPASAAVNNVNSRGQYVPMGSNRAAASRSYGRSYGRSFARSYHSAPTYRQPAYVPAPAMAGIVTAPSPVIVATPGPAPVVAAAPSSSAPVIASVPTAGRRFSYNPAPAGCSPAAGSAVRVQSAQPHAAARRSGGRVEQWQLPKTDPRKYSTR